MRLYVALLVLTLQVATPLAVHAAPGDLDPTFGSGGLKVTSLGATAEPPRWSAVPRSAATATSCWRATTLTARLDTSFGVGGIAAGPALAGDQMATGLARQSDGKLSVQLVNGDTGLCLGSTFDTGDVVTSSATKFTAKAR
jgi:hypothetical protein